MSAVDVESWSGKDRQDENFPVGSRLIAKRFREPIHRYYAFARNADDIADSPVLTADEKVFRLDTMEAVLLGRRDAGSPSAVALRESLGRTGVAAIHATDLLIAFRQDATQRRYATVDDLLAYCRYSANPVGRYVLAVHAEPPACHVPSDALCTALQILNHLQDCSRDLAALDRCYLPQALLDACGASVADLARPAETPGLRRVFDALLHQVEQLNACAAGLPRAVGDRRLRLETGVIVGLAKRLAARLSRHDPLAGRVRLRKGDAVASVVSALRWLT